MLMFGFFAHSRRHVWSLATQRKTTSWKNDPTADTAVEEEEEWETSNESDEGVAKNKVRKFETLPFGHRREHLAAYVPNIKERNVFGLSISLFRKFRVPLGRRASFENSAESPMRFTARLSSSVQWN